MLASLNLYNYSMEYKRTNEEWLERITYANAKRAIRQPIPFNHLFE